MHLGQPPRHPLRILWLLVVLVFCFQSTSMLGKTQARSTTTPQRSQQTKRRAIPQRKPVPSSLSLESFLGEFRAAFAAGNYETALMRVNNTAADFYDQNDFRVAMPLYRAYANLADPFTTIDPTDGQEEAIRKSTVFKDMSRNYVKFMLNTQQVHPELCRTTNCIELAWAMMEQIKSRLLRIDLINSALSRLALEARQEVRALMTRAKDERMARIKLRLATGNLLDPTEKDSTIAAIDAEIARYLPEYTNLAGKIASLEQVRESLADNETLLSFVYTNNLRKVYLFKLERNGPLDPTSIVIKTEILTVNLYDAIEEIKEAMVGGSSLEAVSVKLREVYGGLLDKVNLQPNRRLIIATDQNLSALPFDVLPLKDGRRMIDVFDITYVPSATVFHYLRQKRTLLRAAYGFDYAGFGYRGEEKDSLIHTETEIENAARNFPRSPNRPNATEAEIYRYSVEIANARYLHFATHNYFEPGVDASFYLAFGGGEEQNGRLTSEEIVTRLRNRAELTVLSSCETAQANDNYSGQAITPLDPPRSGEYKSGIVSDCVCSYGESFSNLSGSFFAAGSKELLLTQWKIKDDQQTDIFISKFFASLAAGRSPAQALKETKQRMKQEKPVLWAGFILAGD